MARQKRIFKVWEDIYIGVCFLGTIGTGVVFLYKLISHTWRASKVLYVKEAVELLALATAINLLMLCASGTIHRVRLRYLEETVARLKTKLTEASKHSKTFERFRAEIEERLKWIEQEQERWPKLLINTLTIAPLGIAIISALAYLGVSLLKLLLGLPKP